MLIDDFMPEFLVRERHHLHIAAPAEEVYAALRSTDFGRARVIRWLLWLRVLPAAISLGARGIRDLARRSAEPLDLDAFERQGFAILAEDPPRELLIGLEGAFWRPGGALRPVDRTAFCRAAPPGVARAAWNFTITPDGARGCRVATETRVRAGAGTHLPLRLYWLVIRPGSGLIRRQMLRAVRDQVQEGHRTTREGEIANTS
jgi:hypothetical protein